MNAKLITAIIREKKAGKLIERLKEKKGIITADRSNARGTTIVNQSGEEMEVLTVLIDETQADEVFEFIFFEADINRPQNGIIYQQDIKRASNYKIPQEED